MNSVEEINNIEMGMNNQTEAPQDPSNLTLPHQRASPIPLNAMEYPEQPHQEEQTLTLPPPVTQQNRGSLPQIQQKMPNKRCVCHLRGLIWGEYLTYSKFKILINSLRTFFSLLIPYFFLLDYTPSHKEDSYIYLLWVIIANIIGQFLLLFDVIFWVIYNPKFESKKNIIVWSFDAIFWIFQLILFNGLKSGHKIPNSISQTIILVLFFFSCITNDYFCCYPSLCKGREGCTLFFRFILIIYSELIKFWICLLIFITIDNALVEFVQVFISVCLILISFMFFALSYMFVLEFFCFLVFMPFFMCENEHKRTKICKEVYAKFCFFNLSFFIGIDSVIFFLLQFDDQSFYKKVRVFVANLVLVKGISSLLFFYQAICPPKIFLELGNLREEKEINSKKEGEKTESKIN